MIFSVLKIWVSQLFHDISESSMARRAGNSISQQAAMADLSVTRLVDNFRNINTTGPRKSLASLSDKNVQASMSNDGGLCQLQHCIGAMCSHDVILSRSSDSVHLKENQTILGKFLSIYFVQSYIRRVNKDFKLIYVENNDTYCYNTKINLYFCIYFLQKTK